MVFNFEVQIQSNYAFSIYHPYLLYIWHISRIWEDPGPEFWSLISGGPFMNLILLLTNVSALWTKKPLKIECWFSLWKRICPATMIYYFFVKHCDPHRSKITNHTILREIGALFWASSQRLKLIFIINSKNHCLHYYDYESNSNNPDVPHFQRCFSLFSLMKRTLREVGDVKVLWSTPVMYIFIQI